jgi:membrane protein
MSATAWILVAPRLIGRAFAAWWRDNLLRLGASLAYYTLFAAAPILLVAVAIAGAVFGDEAVRGEVALQLGGLIGPDAAKAVEALVEGARWPTGNVGAVLIGTATTVLAACGVFLELQAAFNTVWRVPRQDEGVREFLWNRAQSFGIVLAIGFLLLVSLAVSAALAAVSAWVQNRLPSAPLVLSIVDWIISIAGSTALFALLFKVLPDAQVSSRDAIIGGFVTALLFSVGKRLIGLYLGHSGGASSYGAAGSVAVLLIWVYYSSQIVLLGAEFTRLLGDWRTERTAVQPA